MSHTLEFPFPVGTVRWYTPDASRWLLGETPAHGIIAVPEGVYYEIAVDKPESLGFLRDFPPVPIAHLHIHIVGFGEAKGYVDLSSIVTLSNVRRLTLEGRSIQPDSVGFMSIEWNALSKLTSVEELDILSIPLQLVDLPGLLALPQLKRLKLAYTDSRNLQLETILQLSQLEMLDVSETNITPASLSQLYGLRHLQKLIVSGKHFSDESVDCFTPFEVLKSLELNNTLITDAGIKSILTQCRLSNIAVRNPIPGTMAGRGFDVASSVPLKSISLRSVDIDDDGLNAICRHKALENLTISATRECPYTHSTYVLRQLTALKRLDISNMTCVTNVFRHFEHLETLRLSHATLTADACNEIGSLAHLTHLDIHKTPISDASFLAWRNLDQLEALSLSDTGLTLKGMTALERCTNLEFLGLWGGFLPKKVLQKIVKLPKLLNFLTVSVRAHPKALAVLCGFQNLKYFATDSRLIPQHALESVDKCLPHCKISHWEL